jgi:trimeric autotransporter adhesin
MWVKLPSAAVASTITLGYGDTGITTDQQTTASVWSNNYLHAWHLQSTSGTDATATRALTNQGATTTTGQVYGGMAFSSAYMSVGSNQFTPPSAQITVLAWVYATSATTWGTIFKNWGHLSAVGVGHFGFESSTGKLSIYIAESSGSAKGPVSDPNTLPLNTWVRVGYTADGSNLRLYVSGASVGTPVGYNGTLYTSNGYANIGEKPADASNVPNPGSEQAWAGSLDEVSISSVGRSAAWIAADYNNQSNNTAFWSLGTEQSVGGGGGTPLRRPTHFPLMGVC